MPNYNPRTLIGNIKDLMDRKRVTQDALAKELGMSQSNVSKALNISEKKSFTLDQVISIAKYFDVSIDMLVGNTNAQSVSTSPRAIASFLAKIITKRYAKIAPVRVEEVIYSPEYEDGVRQLTYKGERKEVVYSAIYFPNHWEISSEDDDMFASQIGNESEVKPVNEFLYDFEKIFDVYKTSGLPDSTYNTVVTDLLSHLKKD